MTRVRVLLADDHRIVAEGLKSLLETEFELVGLAGDGLALLTAARATRPDVIVSDISMPNLNGVEALEELKKDIPDVRIVFLTMHRDPSYARRALDAGASGYVLKHSAGEELVLAVRAAAAGRTFISPTIAGDVLKEYSPGSKSDPWHRLTLRQREILRLLVDGLSAKQIAARLDISPRTVEYHKYSMMETLDISTNAELIRFGVRHGFSDA